MLSTVFVNYCDKGNYQSHWFFRELLSLLAFLIPCHRLDLSTFTKCIEHNFTTSEHPSLSYRMKCFVTLRVVSSRHFLRPCYVEKVKCFTNYTDTTIKRYFKFKIDFQRQWLYIYGTGLMKCTIPQQNSSDNQILIFCTTMWQRRMWVPFRSYVCWL